MKDKKTILFYAIVVALCAFLVINFFRLCSDVFYTSYDYNYSERDYIYRFKEGNYDDTISIFYEEMVQGKYDRENEMQAVTQYFIAASYYRVYEDQEEKRIAYEKEMEDAKGHMGELSYMADDIDRILGLSY